MFESISLTSVLRWLLSEQSDAAPLLSPSDMLLLTMSACASLGALLLLLSWRTKAKLAAKTRHHMAQERVAGFRRI